MEGIEVELKRKNEKTGRDEKGGKGREASQREGSEGKRLLGYKRLNFSLCDFRKGECENYWCHPSPSPPPPPRSFPATAIT